MLSEQTNTKEQMLHDPTYSRNLKQSSSQKQTAEEWLPGTQRRGNQGDVGYTVCYTG